MGGRKNTTERGPHHLRPVLRARREAHHRRPRTHSGRRSESDTVPRGWPWTHSSRRAQARGARPFLSCDGEAGGNQASGCSPWKPRETRGPLPPPHAGHSPENGVSTPISWHKPPASGRTMTAAGEGGVLHVSRRPTGEEPRQQATRHDPIDARGRGGGGGGPHGASWSTPARGLVRAGRGHAGAEGRSGKASPRSPRAGTAGSRRGPRIGTW